MSVPVPRGASLAAAALVSLAAFALPLAADAQPKAATLKWGSYVGGPGADRVTAVTQDSNGDVYVVGTTTSQSIDEPVTGSTVPAENYFIARFTSDGTRVWRHLFGGTSTVDKVNAITVTPTFDIYIAGSTQTSAITGAGTVYGGSVAGEEGFLAKIAYADGFPEWFLYLYGTGTDVATGVVATGGYVYVAGYTDSTTSFLGYTLPARGGDAFVVKVNPSAPDTFPWSPLPAAIIGGAGLDQLFGITVDVDRLVVVGTTRSNPISTNPAPVTPSHGNAEAFVAKLNTTSGAVEWLTHVGGSNVDEGNAITVIPSPHQIVIAGTTTSNDLGGPLPPAGKNAFAAWLAPDGTQLRTRVLGGNLDDEAVSVSYDSYGTAYIGGSTASSDFVLSPSAFDTSIESGIAVREGFVAALPNAGGDGWVSFFGGDAADTIAGVSMGPTNRLYLGLQTSSSTGLPTAQTAAYDSTLNNSPDGYLAALDVTKVTPPVAGNVNDRPALDSTNADIDEQDFADSLSANWNAFMDASGIVKYEWAIGTLADPEAIQRFTSVGTQTSASKGTLSLQVGTRYYVTVRAQNTYGITATSRSDGVLVIGTGNVDGGTGGNDGGTGNVDGGTGNVDGGTGNVDGGTGGNDGGTGGNDGGTGGNDGGTGNADGGTGGEDGGTGNDDGGTGGNDGGTGLDGGIGGDDGGTEVIEPRSPVGWGCAAAGGAGVPLLLGLMVLVLLARRFGNASR